MKQADVIKRTILSEKAYKLMEKGLYTFLVDSRATKKQIAKAVSDQFAVKVKKVNVLSKFSKMKRIAKTRKVTKVGGGKKAIVYLASGQKIAALSPKSASTASKNKDKKAEGPERSRREKEVEKVSPEGSKILSEVEGKEG